MYFLKRLRQQVRNVGTNFRQQGLKATLISLIAIIQRIFYDATNYVIMAKPLTPQKIDTVQEITIQQITTPEQLQLVTHLPELGTTPDRLNTLFETGCTGFMALEGGQVIGYGWLSEQKQLATIRMQAPLQADDICLHDLFVSPTHRGHGIAGLLIKHRLQVAYNQNKQRVIARIDADNLASLNLHKKLNYTHIGNMTHRRFLLWEKFTYNLFKPADPLRKTPKR